MYKLGHTERGAFDNPEGAPDLHRQGLSEAPAARFTRQPLITQRPLLGELAIRAGLIDEQTCDKLLKRQRTSGGRLGEIMVSEGHLHPSELACLLSAQSNLPYVDLASDPADPTLANPVDLDFYIAHQCLPWRWQSGEIVYVASDPQRVRAEIEAHEGRLCLVRFATPRAIQQATQERFHLELSERARFQLAREQPESSARIRFSRAQRLTLLTMAAALIGIGWFVPGPAALTANFIFAFCFLIISALKCISIFVGLYEQRTPATAPHDENSSEADLPSYSILVPLFREAAVLPILTEALRQIDYPTAKLQIILIFEEADVETFAAAQKLQLPGNFEFVHVPFSMPLTKPKACNFALPFARGEFLVVYDAEDLPDPNQLREAASAFAKSDANLACVQARLNYYNPFENWLTRQFTLEYSAFFDFLLPTLEKLRLPIPLGGTSTHFRASVLRAAGAWDPFNVTEDADLGMRFATLGYRTGIISSTTYEEANCRFDNWLRQRSRWIKGWMQTYFVRMRHPVHLFRTLGLRRFLGFQLVIGGFSLSNFIHPLFYVAIGILLFKGTAAGGERDAWTAFSETASMTAFNLMVLVTGYGISILAGMAAVARRGYGGLIISAFATPLYWMLISLGAYKALFQFFSRPFHWEKTEHGLSRFWQQKHKQALRQNAANAVKNQHVPTR